MCIRDRPTDAQLILTLIANSVHTFTDTVSSVSIIPQPSTLIIKISMICVCVESYGIRYYLFAQATLRKLVECIAFHCVAFFLLW